MAKSGIGTSSNLELVLEHITTLAEDMILSMISPFHCYIVFRITVQSTPGQRALLKTILQNYSSVLLRSGIKLHLKVAINAIIISFYYQIIKTLTLFILYCP
jgi:hypothetical protein